MNNFEWTDAKVIDFVNWYLELNKLSLYNYQLENQNIIDSFKNDDPISAWNSPIELICRNCNALCESKEKAENHCK